MGHHDLAFASPSTEADIHDHAFVDGRRAPLRHVSSSGPTHRLPFPYLRTGQPRDEPFNAVQSTGPCMRAGRVSIGAASAIQMVKFALVGIVNTIVDFALFSVLFFGFGLDKIVANTIAFLVAVLNSYILNRRWTFSTDAGIQSRRRLAYFVALNAAGLLISNATIQILSPPLSPLLAKVVATLLTFIWNLATSKFLVFRSASNVL